MFHLNGVTLRPLEVRDIDSMYSWHCDAELEVYSGWGVRRSQSSFTQKWENTLDKQPNDEVMLFGIEVGVLLI